MAQPATYNIEIYRGDTYTFQAQVRRVSEDGTITPFDLTNYTIRGQVRRALGDSAIWFSLTDYRLAITDAANGYFSFRMLSDEIEALYPPGSSTPANGVYDIELTTALGNANSEVRITYLTGSFSILTDITHSMTRGKPMKPGYRHLTRGN